MKTKVADLTALVWFGMWMGLVSKNANTATWKTILFVQMLPWIVLSFAAGLIVSLLFVTKILQPTMAGWMTFVTTAITTAASLAINFALFAWARRKLFTELRQRAAHLISR